MKLKVRFLVNTLSGGGAEKVLADLLNRLDPNAFEISLVTKRGGVHRARIPAHIRFRQIIPCKSAGLQKLLSRIVNKLPPAMFAALFLRGDYDIEIAYMEGRPTREMAAKCTGGAKIAFVHCDLSVKNLIAPFYGSRQECLDEYRSFTKVCFVSEASRAGFEKVIGHLENSTVVHNVVNVDGIRKLSQETADIQYSTDGWKLITVGRLAEEKGYDRLLRVAAALEKDYRFELWIIGDGKEREKLEGIIRESGLRSVRLLGYRENPYTLMKQADLFVCSSLCEGYSTAVTESVALGIPVITTDCAGMDEILDHGKCGLIVANTEAALKDGIAEIFENPEKYARIKQGAMEKLENYSARAAMEEYENLLRLK